MRPIPSAPSDPNTSLSDGYWWDALQYAVLLHNVLPSRSLSDCTPEEAWSGNKPDVSCLCVFGCKAFVLIPDKLRGKLSAKSLICTFVSYARQWKAYRLVHRPSRCFLESCDVVFDEGGTSTSFKRIVLDANNASLPLVSLTPDPPTPSPPDASTSMPPVVPAPTPTPTPITTNVQPLLAAPRPKRTTRPPTRPPI